MKKIIFSVSVIVLLLLSVPATAGILIDESNFPDPQFRALLARFDQDGDGLLIPDEFLAVKEIDCEKNQEIYDLTGIELFTELESLSCWMCPLSSLDVSKNPNLKYLDCCETGLTSLDLSENTQLHQLWAYGNQFTELDLSNCYYLSKAVKNGIANNDKYDGKACSYADDETESYVVVDKATSLKLADETVKPSEGKAPVEPADSGMGGIASPVEGAVYMLGSPVPLDIRPTGSISVGGIWVSGTCEITSGGAVKYSKSISVSGSSGAVKDEFIPDSVGTYVMTVRMNYTLSGMSVDSSRHTRTFTVVDPSATPEPTATPVPTATPAPTATPVPIATPVPTAAPTPTPASDPEPPVPPVVIDQKAKSLINGLYYSIDGKEAVVTGTKKKNAKTITIPATVKINGKKYKVTGIAQAALKDMKKLVSLTIGKNVKNIGKQAAANCPKLKTLTIKSKLLTNASVKSGAFKNDKAVETVKCPGGKKAEYQKLLTKKGLGKKVKWK